MGQGYHFGRPMDGATAERWLVERGRCSDDKLQASMVARAREVGTGSPHENADFPTHSTYVPTSYTVQSRFGSRYFLSEALSHPGLDPGSSAPAKARKQHGASPCRGKPKPRSRKQLRHCEVGWGAAGGELAVRSEANSIRRDMTASLLDQGEAWNTSDALAMAVKATSGSYTCLEAER